MKIAKLKEIQLVVYIIFLKKKLKILKNSSENLSNNSRLQMTTLIKDLNFIWNNSNYNKILKEKLDIKFSENEEETISEKKKPKKPIMSIKIEAKKNGLTPTTSQKSDNFFSHYSLIPSFYFVPLNS